MFQDTAYTSFSDFNKDTHSPFNLSKDEFESLCKLKNESNLVIQKVDTSNAIEIFDKNSYLKSSQKVLEDSWKFKNIPVVSDKDINYVINYEKRVTNLLKKLKNKNGISKETHDKLGPVGSKSGTLFGPAKVHKPLRNGLPSFRSILSTTAIPI